jgi:hypothetical protein
MRLEFTGRRAGRRSAVVLTIPGKCEGADVYLTPSILKVLKDAVRAKQREGPEEEVYLPITAGDVWRLVKQIEESVGKRLEVNDLFENNYRGGYRLRIPPDQIIGPPKSSS